jgi:hypothetical protein
MILLLQLLILLSATAAGWLFWYAIKTIQKGQGRKRSASGRASPHLAKELLILVNGDTATARRLLRNVNRSNPGRSVNWCLEKAIYDLERDRH